MSILRRATLLLLLCQLSACGWQLRGASDGKAEGLEISSLRVISEQRNNAFFRSFSNTLTQYKISIDSQSDVTLQFSSEELERQPLTYSPSGVPAQYQLILSVEYQVSQDGIVTLPQRRITSRRSYDFDADLIIEKDQEQQELLREMREELSERILASIKKAG